jgi:hypothetical protein
MRLISDERCSVQSSDIFKPNTVYEAERQADGRVVLSEIDFDDVPVVEPVRTLEGFLIIPRKVDRKLIAAAIRADRDSR